MIIISKNSVLIIEKNVRLELHYKNIRSEEDSI